MGRKTPRWTLSHAPINLQRKTSWAKVAPLSLSCTHTHTRCEEETFNFPNTFRTNENSSPVAQCRHSRCAAKTSQFPRILFGWYRVRRRMKISWLLQHASSSCSSSTSLVSLLLFVVYTGHKPRVSVTIYTPCTKLGCVGSMSSHMDGFFFIDSKPSRNLPNWRKLRRIWWEREKYNRNID